MTDEVSDLLESGLLEVYVMGIASPEENQRVEAMAAKHAVVRQEIDSISQGLEDYARAHAVKPKASVKHELMATINYMNRIREGEPVREVPMLGPDSRPEDFAYWLNRPDMVAPEYFEDFFVRIIGASALATTALVYIRQYTEPEVHHAEYERFLILEGTCAFEVGSEVFNLKAGDYLSIPLHTKHMAHITSAIPCKAILQRVPA